MEVQRVSTPHGQLSRLNAAVGRPIVLGRRSGGNQGDQVQIVVTYGERAPEHLCANASHSGSWRTAVNGFLEAAA